MSYRVIRTPAFSLRRLGHHHLGFLLSVPKATAAREAPGGRVAGPAARRAETGCATTTANHRLVYDLGAPTLWAPWAFPLPPAP